MVAGKGSGYFMRARGRELLRGRIKGSVRSEGKGSETVTLKIDIDKFLEQVRAEERKGKVLGHFV